MDSFGGKVTRLDPRVKPQGKVKHEPRNFVTNPSRKGTGYGYADVTISRM